MLTSHTLSEEEKIPHHRKFAQNIRNKNEGPQLLGNATDLHECWSLCKLWERRPQVPDLVNSSLPSPPPEWSLNPHWKTSSTASAEEFHYSFYYNEGLENKLTRAPLLGLAKSIYYHNGYLGICIGYFIGTTYLQRRETVCCLWWISSPSSKDRWTRGT